MHLRPFEPQQPIEDMTVKNTEIFANSIAMDYATFFNNNSPSRKLTEADNHHIQHNQHGQELDEQTAHITDKETKSI